MCPYLNHHNAKFWADADQFKWDRFLSSPPPTDGSYLPFGIGPRRCPGRSFALQEICLVFIHLIGFFSFELAIEDTVKEALYISLRPNQVRVFLSHYRADEFKNESLV